MHGFKNLLIDKLQELNPKRILEWGPGYSTELMLQCCPGAEIHSIEHDEIFYQRSKENFGDGIHLHLISATKRNSDYATHAFGLAKEGEFDFIFIDGRRRVECTLVAFQILSLGGVVMMHDWCRENYRNPLKPIARIIEERCNSVVMVPNF